MISEKSKKIIENYIMAYNSFDIESMVKLLHKEIMFRNFTNGDMNTETRGIQEFKELAEKSSKIFSRRRQTVIDYNAIEDKAEVQIEYEAILAVDLPNGLNSGDKIQLKGKSIFGLNEGKISLIEDYS
ncbi:nuclear transport factor 2 family protein [Peribacillus castrilensis]|uniref:SnoaL-like domain-containing protein n=1 Tax=Peribacillus simplex TaxID=1478 RepID=A0AAN2PLB5_9BACI|nr:MULTISPECIES: nuclear transport factor 2 family protein [Bacillaceae]MCP1094783.1 nuclear transport factor 2 family protein [Bacillaceae bacterium OS4b]MBD8588799.1 nuclear transport factor 2 family protein [Peribacillus simplex]MCF7624633.1 nuclear transport factor 2 family protein [Peribacillus frigoritolerans]MCP1155174.1 nuclear transport factor 2 family protein [Peribacillus frigoritolerans]MCT1390631.1 nuclear transport factor 2 family protein [Peribacillus frigoritolerans]